ncbi:formate dehydrogenase subunit delta [Sneathiella sp.]|uniref:formate dehydrogenase subunit delta n=1 Tax=Sneathiella sp. TaxID=1964365 RepID=UPI002FE19D80
MKADKMVTMANQIAAFFKTQPNTDQARSVANHINDFWEPRMRTKLLQYIAEDGPGLDPLILEAKEEIRIPAD